MAERPAEKLALWRAKPYAMVQDLFGTRPDPWQHDVLECFPHTPRIAMAACKGPGKLQPKDTIIPTPASAATRFGDLKPGDPVFAEDGSPTQVVAVHDNGNVPVYRVTFDDGSSTLAGAEHLWKVKGRTERRKNLDWAVLTTAQIVARGVTIPNGRWAQKQFIVPVQGAAAWPHALDLPLDPYVAGVWLGDGLRGQPAYSKPDPEIEQEIGRRGYTTSRAGDRVRLIAQTAAFRRFDCHDANSPDRYVPPAYKTASIAQRTDLLSALMDTDGCIGDDGHMEFSTTSHRLADDVVWLARSLGGVAFVKAAIKEGWYRDPDGRRVECRDCYRVTVCLPFNPFRVARKAARWKDPARSLSAARYLTRFIASIEPAGEADSMCIEVAHPSRCYLTNDFIVTHNTATLSWLAWNFLLTRPQPKVAATSITAENLADNLWTEMASWQNKSSLLKETFVWQKTRIYAKDHPETWWMSARNWPKGSSADEQANTLAGLHADYIMFLLDESGGMPDAVMASADAALSSCIEGHIVQAGNPTHLDGPLYRATTLEKKLWRVFHITGDPDDPKRAPRVHIDWARETIDRYGRDHPYTMVNVLGLFPPSSLNALIGPDDIAAAQTRSYRDGDIEESARILGVDVARFGDDQSVIWPRQGLVAFAPRGFRGLDSTQGAAIVGTHMDEWSADAAFVDDTGGFGAGWIDGLRRLGKDPVGVAFSSSPIDEKFANKRAEIYFGMAKWIKEGGQLPPRTTPGMAELAKALTQTSYTFPKNSDRLIIEPKDLIKVKIGFSPDHADALALTFAFPVTRRAAQNQKHRRGHLYEFDPFANDNARARPQPRKHQFEYDPFGS